MFVCGSSTSDEYNNLPNVNRSPHLDRRSSAPTHAAMVSLEHRQPRRRGQISAAVTQSAQLLLRTYYFLRGRVILYYCTRMRLDYLRRATTKL